MAGRVAPPNPCAGHSGPAPLSPLLRDRAQSQQNIGFVSFSCRVPLSEVMLQ